MPLIKYNNQSLSSITALPSGVPSGKLKLISSQTASNSASISFTSGLTSTYKVYKFVFVNIDPVTDMADFSFNMSTDSGSNYNVAKTSTFFLAQHQGSTGSFGSLGYVTAYDLAQGTGFQRLTDALEVDVASANMSGSLILFNPSSTTYVKHFLYVDSEYGNDVFIVNSFVAGYGNTTSAVNAIQFKFDTGNFSGTIYLYAIDNS